MNHVMLDLETMGQGPDAAIIAIGARGFDPEHGLGPGFYITVDLEDAVRHGGTIDPSTILWWMRQSDEARAEFQRPGQSIETALAAFSAWMFEHFDVADVNVWGNGSDFDNTILSSAYQRAGIDRPWPFWGNRCFRTLKNIVPMAMPRTGTHHNALDDATTQATHAIAMLQHLQAVADQEAA